MKKFLCLALSLLLFTACAGNTENKEKPEISVSIVDRNLISMEEGTYSNNRWTRWVNENSPVNVSWVPIPENNFEQALTIMFNANTAPDLIVSENRALMQTLADERRIQNVSSYIDAYSKDYAQYIKQNEHFRLYTTLNRGTYLFTSERETTADSVIWIRKDYLDALGLPIPQSTEDLLLVARAFTYDDPDKNNLSDTVGIVSTNDIFEQLYEVDRLWLSDENGKVYNSQLTDRYINMLLYKRQLFSEGIIDSSFILESTSRSQIQPWLSGKGGILFSSYNADEFKSLFKTNPSAVVVPLAPISTPYGTQKLRHKSPCGNYIAFNSAMQSPQNGIMFIDWMISGGYHTLAYGIEGEHYQKTDDVITPIDIEKNNIELNYAKLDMPFLRRGTISPRQILDNAPEDNSLEQTVASLSSQALSLFLNAPVIQNIPVGISANLTKVKQFETEWSLFIKDIESEFILSALTPSPISDEQLGQMLINEWYRLDGDNVLSLMQQWYDENKYSFIAAEQ